MPQWKPNKVFIRVSSRYCTTPIRLIKKAYKELRIFIHYWDFNEITVNNHYILLPIQETMYQLSGTKLLSRLDLWEVSNLMRITEQDEWKTTIKTHYCLLHYLVCIFDITYVVIERHNMTNWARDTWYLDILSTGNKVEDIDGSQVSGFRKFW